MILVAGSVDFDPARREDALRAAIPRLAPTRAQRGCLAYTWSAEGVLGQHGVRGADVAKYQVDAREPVYDPSGRPRADFTSR